MAAVFVASYVEALAVIGTLVPGSSIVFAAGVLAGLHALDPWLAAALAILGAILGDGTSYELGRHYRGAIRDLWPLRSYPLLFARGEAYFAANGRKGVFVGRFLGPIRAIVPLVAGMSTMPRREFYAIDLLAVIAWAAAHLLPGMLFGASLELAGAISSRLVALVAILAVGLWLITKLVHLVTRRAWPYVKRLRDRLYVRLGNAPGPLARLLLPLFDPSRHEPMALLISATLLVAGAWLFLGVVEDVVTRDTLVEVDHAIHAWLQGVRSRWGDDVMVTITELASTHVMVAVIAAVALWFAVTRRFRTLAYWVAAAGFAQVLVSALKYALGRARPLTAHATIDGFSLPSGHAAISMVVFGFLAFLLGHGKTLTKQTVYALTAAVIAVLVAFSRIYLGVHWLSDVIASFGLGIAWIALLAIAYIQHVHEGPIRATPVLAIVAATVVVAGGSYVAHHHDADVARYAKPVELAAIPIGAWRDGAWRQLPAARTEIGGQREERFSVQWVAPRAALGDALADAGWVRPAAWKSSATLLWLVPSTPIAALPVLPKFHQGQPPALTYIRALDERTRVVMRLWHVADAVIDSPASHRVPIWTGMITIERAHPQWRLVLVARTDPRLPAPNDALAHAVAGRRSAIVTRDRSADPVLLVE